jgi:tetratricopeptide (TPR) repeat protein
MDLESWLRGETIPPREQPDRSGRKAGPSQAALLGLPVAVNGKNDESLPVARVLSEYGTDNRFNESSAVLSRNAEEPAPLKKTGGRGEPVSEPDDGDSLTDADIFAEEPGRQEEPHLSAAGRSDEREAGPAFGDEKDDQDFTLPLRPLYPSRPISPVSPSSSGESFPSAPSSPAEKRSSEPGSQVSTATANRTREKISAVLLLSVALLLAGFFFFPAESLEDLLQKGREAYARSEYDRSLAYFEKAGKKDPQRLEVLFGTAKTLEALGRKGEAIDAWYRCLQAEPGNAVVYSRIGGLFFDLGSVDNALRNYEESVKLDPSDAESYLGMGRAFEAKGEPARAAEAYRIALKLDESLAGLRETLARVERDLDLREMELQERQERVAMAEEQMLRAAAALVSGDYVESEAHFLRALDLVPDHEEAFLGLAESKIGKGDIEGARNVYRDLLVLHPGSERARSSFQALGPPENEIERDVPPKQQEKESSSIDSSVSVIPAPAVVSGDIAEDGAATSESIEEKKLSDASRIAAEPHREADAGTEETSAAAPEVRSADVSGPSLPDSSTFVDTSGAEMEEKTFSVTPPRPEDQITSLSESPSAAAPAVLEASSGNSDIMIDVEADVSKKEQPRKEPVVPKNNRDRKPGGASRAFSAAHARKPQISRDSIYFVAALGSNEKKLLAESKSFNLSSDFPRAAEHASEALRIQQSPEALSNFGFAHIGLGDYPRAFTAYWRRLLLSSSVRNPSLEPPSFFSLPVQMGRRKEMPPKTGPIQPLAAGYDVFFPVPGGTNQSLADFFTGKEFLLEALRLNPAESDVYLNLSLSYLLMRRNGRSVASFPSASSEGINENSLYLALLAHAWRVHDDEERFTYLLNTAGTQASGDILRFVRSLKRAPLSGKK